MRTLSILLFILAFGCNQEANLPVTKKYPPQLSEQYFLTEDGLKLPLHRWLPKTSVTQAVIVGIHGFNDYGYFFRQPAEYFSSQGIACFAYDQRGFGAAPRTGLWAGSDAYVSDLQSFVRLIKQRYPNIPVYLLGESMGGAVSIAAIRDARMPSVDGIVLAAPAVWSREIMPWYQTSLLWVLSNTVPWLTISGQDVEVRLSDNRKMIQELDSDPLVLRKTRLDALYGLTNLMDAAFENASAVNGNILILYGDRDDIIPKEAIYAFLKRFYSSGSEGKTVGFYTQGYHLLLRDLQAQIIWKDIAAWIVAHGAAKLPSGADDKAREQLRLPLMAWQQGKE